MSDYPYIWSWAKWPATDWRRRAPWESLRKGQRCRVLAWGRGMNSVAVEFEDGYRMVSIRYGLRKVKA